MAWIGAIQMEEADEALRDLMVRHRALYPVEYSSPVSPGGDSIVASHSLMPDSLYHIFAAFGEMMSKNLPLSRMQHDIHIRGHVRRQTTSDCGRRLSRRLANPFHILPATL